MPLCSLLGRLRARVAPGSEPRPRPAPRREPPVRRWRAAAALLAVALTLATVLGSRGPADAAPPADKLSPALAAALAGGAPTRFVVTFPGRPDLRPAAGIADWGARGRFVYDAVRRNAERSQAGVRALLDARGVPYRPLLVNNALVLDGNAQLAAELAARADVARVVENFVVPLPETQPVAEPAAAAPSVAVVEWSISRVRAPDVWSQYGRGEGIVVGSVDTGANYTHPALLAKYRGAAGGGVSHDYNWYDFYGDCASQPCDLASHGSHTVGTMVGSTDDRQIGVAPGAQWISARAFQRTSASFEALAAAADWMLAPTRLGGADPDPARRPHVVNNSWSSDGREDDFYDEWLTAWTAAGMFPAFAAGNYGPVCDGITSPADRALAFATGGTAEQSDDVGSYSSRGPTASGRVKPDAIAPGQNILSASGSGVGYVKMTGTSMASPHTAGLVALLWSAVPELVGDVATTRRIVQLSAEPDLRSECGRSGESPNPTYGWGHVDALSAIRLAGERARPAPLLVPGELQLSVAPGGRGQTPVTLLNRGLVAAYWLLRERPAAAWLAATPSRGALRLDGRQRLQVGYDATGLAAGTYRTRLVLIAAASGGTASVELPVTLTVR